MTSKVTCDNAFSRNIASLTEPQRGVPVLVHPLTVSLVQQADVLIREVVHIKCFNCVILRKTCFCFDFFASSTDLLELVFYPSFGTK